jgi:hypothetical protein
MEHGAYSKVALSYAQRMLSWRIKHAERTLTNMQLTSRGVVLRR